MVRLKRVSAAFLALIMIISMVGCGDTSWAVKIDGFEVRAGIYLYYSLNSYTMALEKLKEEGIDTKNKKEVKKAKVENIPILDWVQKETTEQLVRFVAIEREFDRLELSFDEDELTEIRQNTDNFMDRFEDMSEKNGIGEQSIRDVIASSYKADAILRKHYGIDGLNSITEQQYKDFYLENNARVKYIQMSLRDGSGELLEGKDKEERIKMAEEYLQRLKDGESIDDLLNEYSEFSSALVSEAAAATATDENGETMATTTTTVTTTEEIETTDVETNIDEESNSETSEDEETTITTPEEDDIDSEETTKPFENEVIIQKATTPESLDEEESDETTTVNYRPSKKSNEAIFGDAVVGNPFLIQEDDACYIILKLDIKERMTEDDLWSEQIKDSILYTLYYDKYDEMLTEISDKYEVNKNEAAYKKYNPHKYKIDMG